MRTGKKITGQRFGSLTAVQQTEKRLGAHAVWECLCDCGNTVYANSSDLVAGRVTSCGCSKKEPRTKDANEKEILWNYVRGEDICVCCGAPVLEGRMVCWSCENGEGPVNGRRSSQE